MIATMEPLTMRYEINSKEVIVLVFFILEYIRADIEINALTTDTVKRRYVYVNTS